MSGKTRQLSLGRIEQAAATKTKPKGRPRGGGNDIKCPAEKLATLPAGFGQVTPWEMLEPSRTRCAICDRAVLVDTIDAVDGKTVFVVEPRVSVTQVRKTGFRGKPQTWWFHVRCFNWFCGTKQ